MKYELRTPEQATTLMQTIWPKVKEAIKGGKHLSLEIKALNKSREQEEKYHAMIGDIAKQAKHLGSVWDAESWKRFLLWQYAKDNDLNQGQIVPSLDGTGIVQLGLQSRHFSKEEASDFVEWLNAWGAENGITFTETK
jgi:hypothetical protein